MKHQCRMVRALHFLQGGYRRYFTDHPIFVLHIEKSSLKISFFWQIWKNTNTSLLQMHKFNHERCFEVLQMKSVYGNLTTKITIWSKIWTLCFDTTTKFSFHTDDNESSKSYFISTFRDMKKRLWKCVKSL